MAEIRVEPTDKRNSSPIWPWILGLLLLVGLVWGIAALLDDDDDGPELANTETVTDTRVYEEERVADRTAVAAGPVASFIEYAEADDSSPEMGPDHAYTSEGISKLRAALVAVADQQNVSDQNIQEKKQSFEQAADKIQQDPESLQHANTIKETFTKAADLMSSIQQKAFLDLDDEVKEVRSAAEAIDGNTPTLDQKDEVKEFFSKSADALEEMQQGQMIQTGENNNVQNY